MVVEAVWGGVFKKKTTKGPGKNMGASGGVHPHMAPPSLVTATAVGLFADVPKSIITIDIVIQHFDICLPDFLNSCAVRNPLKIVPKIMW